MSPNGTAPLAAPGYAYSGLCVTPDDCLQVITFGNVAGVRLTIAGRVVDPLTGVVTPFAQAHVPNSDRTVNTTSAAIGVGILQAVTVAIASGSPAVGGVFVRIDITRGSGATATPYATLIQGFVSAQQRQAWPGAVVTTTIASPGTFRSVTGTNPAAGAEISETVPAGARYRLVSMQTTLVTDATAITRTPTLVLDDGANAYYNLGAIQTITASLTRRITWAHGYGTVIDTNSNHGAALPTDLWLLAGHRFRTSTLNLQAGDDYAAPQYLVEEKLEGA